MEGTARDWTRRVIIVLLKIVARITHWPDQELEHISRAFEHDWDALGICNLMRRIRYLAVGNVGWAWDNPIWTASKVYLEDGACFTGLQYLLANSAFQPGDHCILMFKKEQGETAHGSNEVGPS